MLRALAVLACLCAAGTSSFAAPAKGNGAGVQLPAPETWTLENGLQVAYLRVPKAPAVTVQLWYHVGSKDEPSDRRGSAHMFEHMMFKGSEHLRAEEHAQHLSAVGGYVNAFTTEDATAYHNTVPTAYMDYAVQLEAERMRNLWFRDEMIAAEKKVVQEEIRRQSNNPLYVGFLRFLELAYTTHPYSWTAGGTTEDLQATSVDDLKNFYDRYYVPNNALLIVVGNVSKDEVAASASRWFGPISKGAQPPRPAKDKAEPTQSAARKAAAKPAQIGLVMRGYHVPEAAHADMPALQVLALILAGGESSRLFERLVRKDKSAIEAGGQLVLREDPGLFMVFGAFVDPSKADAVDAALVAEVERLRTGKVSVAELNKAVNQLQADFVYGLESVTGLANQLGTSWIHTGDVSHFLQDLQAYASVSAADIQRVAKSYFRPEGSTSVVIPPAGSGAR